MNSTLEAPITSTKWSIDPSHSEIHFKIRHLMISTVTGTIGKFQGTVETDGDDFSKSKISFTAESSSISTGDAQRDQHLASADFFLADEHPEISFQSTGLEHVSGSHYTMTGELNIRGISKTVTLDVEHAGVAKDPWGNTKAGFNITGTVNRKDWGLNWNAALEAGGFLLADEVKILCEVQLSKN